MELFINLADIRDVEEGFDFLNKLMQDPSLSGAATLTEPVPGKVSAMDKLPVLQREPESAPPNTAKAPAVSEAEGRPYVGPVAAVEPPVKRPRGRPPGSSTKRDAAEAAAQLVSVALPGVPARNLASALEGDGEPAQKAESAAIRADPAEPAQVRTAIAQNSPLSDPDLAGAFDKPQLATSRPYDKSVSPDGPELFPGPATNDLLAGRSLIELERLWRIECAKRGYSWSRKMIKRHNVSASSEFTRAMLIDVLTNP
jgi:hypothetical protein